MKKDDSEALEATRGAFLRRAALVAGIAAGASALDPPDSLAADSDLASYLTAGTFTKQQTFHPDSDVVPIRAMLNSASSKDRSALDAGSGTPYGPPPQRPTLANSGVAGKVTGTVRYGYTEGDPNGETTLSPAASITVSGARVDVTLPLPRRGIIGRTLYRTTAGGSTFRRVSSMQASESGGNGYYLTRIRDNVADADLGPPAPTQDTTEFWALQVREGVKYFRTPPPPRVTGVGDITVMTADPSNNNAWAIDAYGPITARSRGATCFVASHVGNSGAHLSCKYVDDSTPPDAASPVPFSTVFTLTPKGTLQMFPFGDLGSVMEVRQVAGAKGHVLIASKPGDPQSRLILDQDSIAFGPGPTPVDFMLRRTAIGRGTITGSLDVGGSFLTVAARLTMRSDATASSVATADSTPLRLGANAGSRLALTPNGAVVAGKGALSPPTEMATTATDGLLYIPTVNGRPTGTPAAVTGAVPICFDRSANRLWVYNGSWRASSGFA